MKNEYRFGYDEMLIQIQACVPDSQKGDGLVPIGPLRYLPMMISAMPLASVLGW